MTATTIENTQPSQAPRHTRARTSLLARGEPMLWISGGGLAVSLCMIVGLLAGVLYMGMSTFWQTPLIQVELNDGTRYLGEVTRSETFIAPGTEHSQERRLFRTGNFELTQTHFHWVEAAQVAAESTPEWAVLLEREEWGRFYGFPSAFLEDGVETASGAAPAWAAYQAAAATARGYHHELQELKKHRLGAISRKQEQARLLVREAELRFGAGSAQHQAAQSAQQQLETTVAEERAAVVSRISDIEALAKRFVLRMRTVDDKDRDIVVSEIVLAVPANQLSFSQRLGIYLERWQEYLFEDPREANSEGGVFPAIFGTVVMTLLMIMVVVPFGVLAALYLREYAKGGALVSAIRIAINNLAGVPSIVFGVFGLGFFCYAVGGWIDSGPDAPFGVGTWFGVAVLLALFIGSGLGIAWFRSKSLQGARAAWLDWAPLAVWTSAAFTAILLIWYSPWFHGFYQAKLPNPTFGTGGVLWASLTLALLALPVVIVSTEEALAAVPRSMREGSYACGASKWQTMAKIVLPRAMPGILTGTILAMARGAGEVAPLMLVGAVKLAPELPVDFSDWSGSLGFIPLGPLHPERSFMHLGFHIYDLGFQSQNSEAAKPMVFTTTLLLIAIVVALNCAAIVLRSRLRRRFNGNQF